MSYPQSARTRIKICCVADATEARLAIEAGVDVLGLVGGPEGDNEAALGTLAAVVPPGVATFLRTGLMRPEMLIPQHTRCRSTALEIAGELPTEAYPLLREKMPGVGLVQAIRLTGNDAVSEALGAGRLVDALLLDMAGDEAWDVAAAIAQIRPFGVCVERGVRTNGKIDAGKLAVFVAAVQAADADRRAGAVG